MKLKIILLIVTALSAASSIAQTEFNKTIPVQAGQKINMHFDYPEIIRVSTWDRKEIVVQGKISINNGENDDAFVFDASTNGNTINLSAYIKGLKDLPQRITVFQDGKRITFKDKTAFREYQTENGKTYNSISQGADIEITLDIKIPKDVATRIESIYGMVEIKDFNGPLDVEATYGGVDAVLAEKSIGEISAETNYGEIFTNFDTKFNGDGYAEKDFHTYVSAKPGSGPRYKFESKYGNVYLRKPN